MRALFVVSLSAALLSGCLTTQENPNYEHSTVYRGDQVQTNQYAEAMPVETTVATYEATPVQPVYAHTAPVTHASTSMTAAPTDTAYGSGEVTGTPGFMAMQNDQQTVSYADVAPTMPAAQIVTNAPMGAAGTPVAYDYSRNLISVDAVTSQNALPNTVRVMQGAEQNYVVQPGDTVYSLSRKACIGVNVIQSMNGLGADYAIKIGQTLTLPTSVC